MVVCRYDLAQADLVLYSDLPHRFALDYRMLNDPYADVTNVFDGQVQTRQLYRNALSAGCLPSPPVLSIDYL